MHQRNLRKSERIECLNGSLSKKDVRGINVAQRRRHIVVWFCTTTLMFIGFAFRLLLIDVRFSTETLLKGTLNQYVAGGKLRLDWTRVTLQSQMAKRIEAQMTDCSLPLGKFQMRNRMGLGSDLHVWSQVLCNAMDEGVRVWSPPPWQWRDEQACEHVDSAVSSLDCYFPLAEVRCEKDASVIQANQTVFHDISSPYNSKCPGILGENATSHETGDFRASAMEYLFQSVSPLVIQEAERQLKLNFPQGKVPPNLVTVQMRWGDKKREMKLLPAADYVKGVERILEQRQSKNGISVFLATEDPKAVSAFREAAPKDWNIYVDQYFHDMLPHRNKEDVYNQGPKTARETKGRAGLVALGSLLVGMEANYFVLTTASNWSRLMNELRKNVLNPRCNNCTLMIDLKSGEW